MATWKVGASRDLSIDMSATWDASSAKARVFAWAGFDGDSPDSAKAAKAFLVYDSDAPDLRGSYKLPFADVSGGKLVAIAAAIRNAASRLPQTDLPADVRDRARAVVDGYMQQIRGEDAVGTAGLQYKAYPVEFKAGDKGIYEGYFSIFGNQDDGGDVMMAGAFAKTIAERAARIKVFFGHDWSKLIGPPPDMLQEDAKGLYAKGRLTLGSFWGNEAWQLMKDGALREGSIGYQTVLSDWDPRGVRFLKEVMLLEISPVPLGMNPLTEVQAVKMFRTADASTLHLLMAAFKAGARHSKDDMQMIQDMHDMCVELGAACAPKSARSAIHTPQADRAASGALGRAYQMRAASQALERMRDNLRRMK